MQATLERLRERREERGDEGGFTLIELLIVIVILGILAAIVVFAVQNLTSQSAKASCGSDFKTVETAMETYKAQVGHYPANGSAAVAGGAAAVPGDNYSTTPGGSPTTNTGGLASDGVQMLFTTQKGVDGSTVGSWLKDVPANGNLYRIGILLSSDGSGDFIVVKNLSSGAVSPSTASLAVASGVSTVGGTATANGTCGDAGL